MNQEVQSHLMNGLERLQWDNAHRDRWVTNDHVKMSKVAKGMHLFKGQK